jgi:predicted alpha/beta hydrolase family esterase
MKTAIIIHGYYSKEEFFDIKNPASSNDHWIPWLQRQLLLNGIETQTPEMPGFYEPNYEKWKDLLDKFEPNENTILVGHSCGGGFILRWLSENNKKVGKVILVAPWLDPNKQIDPSFFDFKMNSNLVLNTKELILFYSKDDFSEVIESVNFIKSILKDIKIKEFENKGHFVLKSLNSKEFPELLDTILE